MLVKSQVKYIQSLSQKKLRDETQLFIAEGPKIINELLRIDPGQLSQLFATKNWLNANEALLQNIPADKTLSIDEKELERISSLTTPNEVLAIFRQPETTGPLELHGQITLALDGIQDPGNLGTIIRCADWFGISQIICSPECADVYNPKVVQSTMGSIGRVTVRYTPLLSILQDTPVTVYAATLGGKDVRDISRLIEGIIIIGNESKGINPQLLSENVIRLTIRGNGNAESLNAAVATGIILSHLT